MFVSAQKSPWAVRLGSNSRIDLELDIIPSLILPVITHLYKYNELRVK